VKGLKFNDEAATVNQLVPELRAQGVEAIVVLIHQGGVQTGSTVDINACAGNLDGSPIKTIVSQLDDAVDLVISGHTHAAYNCQLPLASGRLIPVTSANTQGKVLTDIDITLDRTPARWPPSPPRTRWWTAATPPSCPTPRSPASWRPTRRWPRRWPTR
jgi:5'-nucleotidase